MPKASAPSKRDEFSMKFTSINVPLSVNPKIAGSSYLKAESNTLWARKKAKEAEAIDAAQSQVKRGSNIIVIHPGSRFLRMGRASDAAPLTISNVIARRHKSPVLAPTATSRIYRSSPEQENTGPATKPSGDDEYGISVASEDPVDARIVSIAVSLRDRMRFYKLKVAKDAADTASRFNSQVKPELIPEENDPFRINWVTSQPTNDYVVGERVFRLVNPHEMGYAVRWPLYGNRLNMRQYISVAELMGDIEAIWTTLLRNGLKVDKNSYKDYSIVLLVPDFYERSYLREMCHLLLVTMGFKQVCVQQESLSATFGAGISNACVIDIGSVKTSISCVDEGMVIADSRMVLSMAGDDITEFLFRLLERIEFPYRDIDLARAYDWQVLEDLKSRLCTLAEGDVAENVYDFSVRGPNQDTKKYAVRAYDEIILAPMCIFEPRVIDFDGKLTKMRPPHQAVIEEVVDHPSDYASQAMLVSTQHLLPPPEPIVATSVPPATIPELPSFSVAPQPAAVDQAPPSESTFDGAITPNPKTEDSADMNVDVETVDQDSDMKPVAPVQDAIKVDDPPEAQTATATATDPPPEPTAVPVGAQPAIPKSSTYDPTCSFPGGFPIDVEFEASKLPLDVAVFNSARACGGDEKIRKYLQAVLVVGGTSLIPGMAHALESRLQAIATPLVVNMEKVQIIPPAKDVDPRAIAWKGACVLAKMDGFGDMCVNLSEWDKLELRAIRERCFFL